jgi:hypothetical protein
MNLYFQNLILSSGWKTKKKISVRYQAESENQLKNRFPFLEKGDKVDVPGDDGEGHFWDGRKLLPESKFIKDWFVHPSFYQYTHEGLGIKILSEKDRMRLSKEPLKRLSKEPLKRIIIKYWSITKGCLIPSFKIGKRKYRVYLFLSGSSQDHVSEETQHQEIEDRIRRLTKYYVKLEPFLHPENNIDVIHKRILYLFLTNKGN